MTLQQVLSVYDSPVFSSPLVLCANLSITVEARAWKLEEAQRRWEKAEKLGVATSRKVWGTPGWASSKMWKTASKEDNNLLSSPTSRELIQTLGKLSDSRDSEARDWVAGSDLGICVTEGLKEAIRKYLSGREIYHSGRADPALVQCYGLDDLQRCLPGLFLWVHVFSITTWMKRVHSQKRATILPPKTQRPVLASSSLSVVKASE